MILFVQNDPLVPPAEFAGLLKDVGRRYEIWRAYAAPPPPELEAANGLVVLGGTMGVHDEKRFPFLEVVKGVMRRALANKLPLLGICLGGQLLADICGARVTSASCSERGLQPLRLTDGADPLFRGIATEFFAFQWHDDSFALPDLAVQLAASPRCPQQAFRIGNAWGLQFHPEVDGATVSDWCRNESEADAVLDAFVRGADEHRQMGRILLKNFLHIVDAQVVP